MVSVVRDLQLPIKFIGVGEKIDDLRDFDAEVFVDALLGNNEETSEKMRLRANKMFNIQDPNVNYLSVDGGIDYTEGKSGDNRNMKNGVNLSPSARLKASFAGKSTSSNSDNDDDDDDEEEGGNVSNKPKRAKRPKPQNSKKKAKK